MVGKNGVMVPGVRTAAEQRGFDDLPEPDLPAAGRAVIERRFLTRETGGATESARERFWAVAACVALGSAAHEGEEAQARRRRDYYLTMAGLEFLPSAAALANAGREHGR